MDNDTEPSPPAFMMGVAQMRRGEHSRIIGHCDPYGAAAPHAFPFGEGAPVRTLGRMRVWEHLPSAVPQIGAKIPRLRNSCWLGMTALVGEAKLAF